MVEQCSICGREYEARPEDGDFPEPICPDCRVLEAIKGVDDE